MTDDILFSTCSKNSIYFLLDDIFATPSPASKTKKHSSKAAPKKASKNAPKAAQNKSIFDDNTDSIFDDPLS